MRTTIMLLLLCTHTTVIKSEQLSFPSIQPPQPQITMHEYDGNGPNIVSTTAQPRPISPHHAQLLILQPKKNVCKDLFLFFGSALGTLVTAVYAYNTFISQITDLGQY